MIESTALCEIIGLSQEKGVDCVSGLGLLLLRSFVSGYFWVLEEVRYCEKSGGNGDDMNVLLNEIAGVHECWLRW